MLPPLPASPPPTYTHRGAQLCCLLDIHHFRPQPLIIEPTKHGPNKAPAESLYAPAASAAVGPAGCDPQRPDLCWLPETHQQPLLLPLLQRQCWARWGCDHSQGTAGGQPWTDLGAKTQHRQTHSTVMVSGKSGCSKSGKGIHLSPPPKHTHRIVRPVVHSHTNRSREHASQAPKSTEIDSD
jgi:hypothetical protein